MGQRGFLSQTFLLNYEKVLLLLSRYVILYFFVILITSSVKTKNGTKIKCAINVLRHCFWYHLALVFHCSVIKTKERGGFCQPNLTVII